LESRAFALITGLFVLGLGACIVVWAHWLARDPLARKPYRVVSAIPVSGLKQEAAVRYRGMEVGRVTSIGLDKRDKRHIQIGIEVNEEIEMCTCWTTAGTGPRCIRRRTAFPRWRCGRRSSTRSPTAPKARCARRAS
jgi:hypothetical protein